MVLGVPASCCVVWQGVCKVLCCRSGVGGTYLCTRVCFTARQGKAGGLCPGHCTTVQVTVHYFSIALFCVSKGLLCVRVPCAM